MLKALALLAGLGIVTSSATVKSPPTRDECVDDVPFADSANCSSYYQCFNIGSEWLLVHLDCPPGGIWDASLKTCVEGICEEESVPEPTTSLPDDEGDGPHLPEVHVLCNSNKLLPYPGSCTKYYHCIITEGSFIHSVFECQPDSYFNAETGSCTLGECPENVEKEDALQLQTIKSSVKSLTKRDVGTKAAAKYPCPSEGFFANPDDCKAYYWCVNRGGKLYQYLYKCPTGSYWGDSIKRCTVGACPTPSP